MIKVKSIYKALFLCFSFAVCFFLVGYLYLNSHISNPTDNEVSKVPYYSSVPSSAGIMFEIADNNIFIELDFEGEAVSVIFAESEFSYYIYGYKIDYTIKGERSLFAGIIDNIGGIDLKFGEELLNCTGNQVLDYLMLGDNNREKLTNVLTKMFEKISQNGITREDLVYIIKNSSTNLSIPRCYNWCDYLKETCKYVRFVN